MTKPTDLAPVFRAGRIALRDGEKTLTQVAATLLEPLPEETSTEVVPFPKVPHTPVLTDTERKALRRLPEVYSKVLVEDRRALTGDEIAALYDEREVVRTVVDTLKGRVDVINENVRHHVDVEAEAHGEADPSETLRDAQGHYILAAKGQPTRVHIPGTNQDFSLEYRSGSTGGVTIDSNHLLDLYEDGEITREQYLALTREVRVFDEEKASKAILKDESLLEVIAKITRRTADTKPGTSLYIRKAK